MEPLYTLKRIAKENGWEFRDDYSGRGMLGHRCVGIVGVSAEEIVEATARVGVTGAFRDNMGFDVIVYWPHISGVAETVSEEVQDA